MQMSNFKLYSSFIVAINLAIYAGFASHVILQQHFLQPFKDFKRYAYSYVNAHTSVAKVATLEMDPEDVTLYAKAPQVIALPVEASRKLEEYHAAALQVEEDIFEEGDDNDLSIGKTQELEAFKLLEDTLKTAVHKGSLATRKLIIQNLNQFYQKIEALVHNKDMFSEAFLLKNNHFLTQEIYEAGLGSTLVDYDLKDLLCEFRKEFYMDIVYGDNVTDPLNNRTAEQRKLLNTLQAFIKDLENLNHAV